GRSGMKLTKLARKMKTLPDQLDLVDAGIPRDCYSCASLHPSQRSLHRFLPSFDESPAHRLIHLRIPTSVFAKVAAEVLQALPESDRESRGIGRSGARG